MLLVKFGIGIEIVVVGENCFGVKSIEKMFVVYGLIYKYDFVCCCLFYWGYCVYILVVFDIE